MLYPPSFSMLTHICIEDDIKKKQKKQKNQKKQKKQPGFSLPPPLSSIKAKLWRQLSNILVSSFALLFSYFQTQPQESLHPMFSNTTRHLTSPYFQFISLPSPWLLLEPRCLAMKSTVLSNASPAACKNLLASPPFPFPSKCRLYLTPLQQSKASRALCHTAPASTTTGVFLPSWHFWSDGFCSGLVNRN